METRHVNALMSALEEVNDAGAKEIKKSVLRVWYGRDRITKPVWRDIQARWTEINETVPLFVGDGEGSFTFIFGDGLTASAQAWFQPLVEWADLETKE